MSFQIPADLIIKETEHWIVNHRVGTSLPGYMMVASRRETTELHDLPAEALAELGPLLALAQKGLTDLFDPERIYVGRYGHTPGHSIHFHVIPIYDWVLAAFAEDERYRVLRSFYTPGVETSDPDGAELTLYIWREFCESTRPPQIHGASVEDAIRLLREKMGGQAVEDSTAFRVGRFVSDTPG